ncbi:hypothetical protein Tco_1140439 [Tanacetum coccineum]
MSLHLQALACLEQASYDYLWIPTTVPATTPTTDPPVVYDDTSLIPAETPTISPITSTIPPTAPTTHYTSAFIYTDSSDDDTPDTPPSSTHEIPPVEVAQPTNRILPTSPSVRQHFTLDDSSRDSTSCSSSKTSLNSSTNALSDSSPSHSSSDHSSSTLPSGMRSSHQLCSSVPSIPHSSAAITDRPSHSSPAGSSRKRSRSSDSVTDLEAEIDECIAYADTLRARGIVVRVVVETVAREEVETGARGTVEVRDDRVTHPVVPDDIPEPAQEDVAVEVTYETLGDLVQRFHDYTVDIPVHRVQAIESIQRDQGHRIVATSQQGTIMSERISELEWDNTRLRGMLDAASQRVARRQHRELRVQREMRQI